ncbi:hypothetical protein O3M35_007409 [Rhynocoris fuscipes]|uniref:S-adenosylmethionine decarboxylase proenzyme n=1 Tax=Rhynocoris fuscipes TaxID=488301 RepID=A0AAW1DC11_9HEMI
MAVSKIDDVQYFEGVEKLLEIWFKKRKEGDLRNIPRQSLESLLKIVHCEVISFSSNDKIDAYVLRKNFKRPDLQKIPHRSFETEVAYLDTLFEDGIGYCMGDPNGDCWYLYTLQGSNRNAKCNNEKECEGDQTLEILMTELDPEVMNIFTKKYSASAGEVTKVSGIDKILPQMAIDDFLFEPCGYSMNGISEDGSYMTIHVTPEPDFSYVSFETNAPRTTYRDIIQRVLDVFHPGKFVLTLFSNKDSIASDVPGIIKEGTKYKSFGDLQCHEVQYCPLRNYDLSFAFYSKFPS